MRFYWYPEPTIVVGILIFLMAECLPSLQESPYAYGTLSDPQPESGPIIRDPNLKVETVFRGIDFPSSMAFLGENDILVLEKNEGTVRRIVNGIMLEDPLLKVNVSSVGERGMLGIAVLKDNSALSETIYVFLYYTEETQRNPNNQNLGEPTIRNRLYRYELADGKLIDPRLLLDLPSGPKTIHNGGALTVGTDRNIYLVVGDLYESNPQKSELVSGRAGILRIDKEGKAVKNENEYFLGSTHPLNKYYAYGIRNSFGIAFDPLTGNLWDTENGPGYGDEINLVKQGFNSGWANIQGFWTGKSPDSENIIQSPDSEGLQNFNGKLAYSPPELGVYLPIGLTAIEFVNSSNYGKEYENNMLVGDFHNGNLYQLELSEDREELLLNGQLSDRIADNLNDLEGIILGQGFGGITDVEVGPDGNIYVLSLYQGGDNCEADKPEVFPCIMYNSLVPGTLFRIESNGAS